MSSSALRVVRRADVRSRALSSALQRQLERYKPRLRPAILALAGRHPYLAQLAHSFPAFLLTLAWPRTGFDPAPVIAGVIIGRSLPELAARAGVPFWLRRMQPEMLPGPLPVLPDSLAFASRIGNHFPQHPVLAPRWFLAVSQAARWVHDDFALWCAGAYCARQKGRCWDPPERLYLWAWFSGQPETLGHRLIEHPWNADMERRRALDCAWAWRERVELALNMAGQHVAHAWLQPGYADGYAFVPLMTAEAIEAEANAMRNCLRSYGDVLVSGRARVWSMQRDGERIATLEVGVRDGAPMPHIQQLCLVENGVAPSALWQSAWRWLVNQDLSGIPECSGSDAPLDRAAWQALWRPYWLAMARVPPWLPLGPSRNALYDL